MPQCIKDWCQALTKLSYTIPPKPNKPMKKICYTRQQKDRDRISFLPDALQTHILSFLPIEDAFRTSLLSTRWRHACCSLPRLGFIQSDFDSKPDCRFNEVVDGVLRAHNETDIDCFDLVVKVDDAPVTTHHLDEWISVAVGHNVKDFCLRDESGTLVMYRIPSSLITCTTLEVLRLRYIKLEFLTTAVCFPTLKHLSLTECCLTDAGFSTFNCPVLETIVIQVCNFKELSISSCTLKYLKIYLSIRRPKINLSIPSLNHLHYIAEYPPNISFETLYSLEDVCFNVRPNRSRNQDLAEKIFKGMHNVRKLVLTEFYLECLAKNRGLFLLHRPAVPCCRHLKVLTLKYSRRTQVPVLKLLLRCYPKLQSLKLWYDENTKSPIDDNSTGGYGEEKETHRKFLKSLKKVDFIYFRGTNTEFEFMKYFVENAAKLKTLKISSPPQEEIIEEHRKIIDERLKLYYEIRVKKLKARVVPFEALINGMQWQPA